MHPKILLNGDEEVGGIDGAGYMAREVGMKPQIETSNKTPNKVPGDAKAILDIRYFAELDIPGALYGAAGDNAHAAEEWADLDSLEKNKEILLKFLSEQTL